MAKRNGLRAGQRFEILKRDKFTCQYCGAKAPDVQLQVDHFYPVSIGGSNKPYNLFASCFQCNIGKRNSIIKDIPKPIMDHWIGICDQRLLEIGVHFIPRMFLKDKVENALRRHPIQHVLRCIPILAEIVMPPNSDTPANDGAQVMHYLDFACSRIKPK